MLTAAAQNGSDFCKRRTLPSFELKIIPSQLEKNHLAGKYMNISPTLYHKLVKIKNGAPKNIPKIKMSTLTETSDHRSEWSVFQDLYVTIFAFYTIINVSFNVLEIGVFTACNNFICLCPKSKLKGSLLFAYGINRFSHHVAQF